MATQGRRQKFLQYEKSRGMCELLVHSRTPGGLVRRPVSFNHKIRSVIVKLTIILDGSKLFMEHIQHSKNIIQSIERMAQDYQEHIRLVALLLEKLLQQNDRTKAVFQNNTLVITLPSSMFAPHSPSKGRAQLWLSSVVGIDPELPGFDISEEDVDEQPIDLEYFKNLQHFLDHVDTLIESIGAS
ncbi:hypothetical protein BJV82DRAFT_608523 [Fennellomyces sp. T-0311]|nr:hypothetical protein BJV82DRAFT_611359 [Fennellomyces sp. T-0311]KAI8144155.1 hypothetical protein BJV82DRAFT_608523 [Fennellomyces sp. T-0311]